MKQNIRLRSRVRSAQSWYLEIARAEEQQKLQFHGLCSGLTVKLINEVYPLIKQTFDVSFLALN